MGNCTIFTFSGETTIYLENPKQTGGTITSTSPDQSAVTISGSNRGIIVYDGSIVSENAVGVECNGGVAVMESGRIQGGTYGISCDNGDYFRIYGGTAYFTSQTGCKPTLYHQDKDGYYRKMGRP